MKRLAVFGSNGYIGKQLMCYFRRQGCACEGFDMPESDVTDLNFWEVFNPEKYGAVLFFAGLTGTEQGFNCAEKYLSVNEGGLLNLLTKLAKLGSNAPKIVFPSTRLVYKGSDEPLVEDAPKEAKTVYAVNKLACEHYLEAYGNRYGIPYSVLRVCIPYGSLTSSRYSYGTIGFFMKKIESGEPITLFGGGNVERTFTHVEDICRAVECLMPSRVSGVYNIGGENLSLRDCARMMVDRFGGGIVDVPWPREAELIESGSTKFDAAKLCNEFGWHPRHTLKDEIGNL